MKVKMLSEMKEKESGTVHEIKGGKNLIDRLNSLGLTNGVKITVISSMPMKGPVTVQIGSSTIAIGSGMAQKILVRVSV